MPEEQEDTIDVTGMTLREVLESTDPRVAAAVQQAVQRCLGRREVYWTSWSEDGSPIDGY